MEKIVINSNQTGKSVQKQFDVVKSVAPGHANMLYLDGSAHLDGALTCKGVLSTGEAPMKVAN